MPANPRHLLGTREIVLLHHHDCGRRTFTDTEFARRHTGAMRGFVLDQRTGALDEVT
ncbi:hypothetical protein [Amycolatopsis sp. cmx-8-4]|uniref:hypothetical protein n=1 Tax=Amycolatopsis sp. cmx-8-4 TaxID=2790947 RepID=UPI003979A015